MSRTLKKSRKTKKSTTSSLRHPEEGYIELTVCSDVLSKPNAEGKQRVIKKDLLTKLSMYIYDIEGHEQVINEKGGIVKGYTRIYHRNLGPIVVKESYDTITQLKDTQNHHTSTPIGFRYGTSK